MTFVALLRGINVGGNNKIDMKELKAGCENAGLKSVVTYINSGNIVFDDARSADQLTQVVENVIREEFHLSVKVLIRDLDNFTAVARALPASWVNDGATKSDVMFLWAEVDGEDVLDRLPLKPGIADVRYVNGAVLCRVDRADLGKSGMSRLVGSRIYKHMTIRNSTTVRNIFELMTRREA